MRPTPHQLLVRELILQLKTGRLNADYFRRKFGVEILDEWNEVWREYQTDGYLTVNEDSIELTRDGLVRVDGLSAGVLRAGTPRCAVYVRVNDECRNPNDELSTNDEGNRLARGGFKEHQCGCLPGSDVGIPAGETPCAAISPRSSLPSTLCLRLYKK